MPTYQLKCSNGHIFDRYLKLKNYNDPQVCDCGAPALRQIVAPMIAPRFEEYESPIDGRPITSKRKRLDDLARHNCVPYEKNLIEENNKKLRDEELKLEKAIDQTVDMEIAKMPAKKREHLESELSHGLTLDYYRGEYGN